MAKLLKGTVKEGHFCLVENINPRHFALKQYILGWIEWDSHSTENCLLFTQRELDKASERAKKKIDLTPSGNRIFNSSTRFGHISFVKNENKKCRFESNSYNFVRMHHFNDSDLWYAFTEYELNRIMMRTCKNKEDCVNKSLITDLLD